jgi:2-hydroxychromene-2-carboxylate isomerase
VKLLFDFLSPYAYIAWHRVRPIAAVHGRVVEPVPVLLAGLLGAHGTKGPAEVVAKRPFLVKDTARAAAAAGVPFGPPPSHPFNPLLALRVAGLVDDVAARTRLVDALYAEVWGGGGRGVTDPEIVASVASAVGLDGAALVAAAASDEAKARLRAATEAAIAANVFGVPTILVDGELFWGNDNLEYVDAFLAGRDPVTPEYLAQWKHVRPSASR